MNSKFWRKRTIEQEEERINRLKRKLVFSRIGTENDFEEDVETANRVRRLLKLEPIPSCKKRIRRLSRKLRRIKNGTYRKKNRETGIGNLRD